MNVFRSAITFTAIIAFASPIFADDIPLKRVVIFNSGVSYFQRDGEVNGDAKVELTFKVEQINDLLKSLVLNDRGGGKIAPVTYASRDPLSRALKAFALDVTDNPTLGDLLNRIRGVKVSVQAPNEINGVILGVEKQQQKVKDEVIEISVLNILTADGMRAIPLAQVQQIKILDAALDAELRKAMELLATSHDTQRKSVALAFTGKGKRAVSVGYILETPVWKTSYRLQLEDKKAPFLQGWAVVENTTDEDWKDVSLALVAGRPISFIQDLYTPLYVPRPVVVPEIYASLRPQVYDEGFDKFGDNEKALRDPGAPKAEENMPRAPMSPAGKMRAMPGAGLARGGDSSGRLSNDFNGGLALNAESGVSSMAQAANVGELFQYAIEQPVSIARQKSAMIPIVNEGIEAEKVSIYNENVQRKFPLNGVRLKNTTKLHLMQGPITVFDGGVYAGDSRIEDLQPKEERLISYAMDLAVEVEPLWKDQKSDMTSVRIVKGTLETTYKYVREKNYNVKNKADEKKAVLIEHPFESQWKLVTPEKAPERTPTVYRFRVDADAGKSATLVVREEMVNVQQVGMFNLDENGILFYVRSKVVSAKVKEALQKVVAMKMKLNEMAQQQSELQRQTNEIAQDQGRIRENMKVLPQDSPQFRDYVKQFGEQDAQLKSLREQIKKLMQDATKQRKEIDEYLGGLQAE